MAKKRYNDKARKVVNTQIDNTEVQKIKLAYGLPEYVNANDTTNLLALPSKKRSTNIVKDKKEKTRILSKQQRKKLEKIVELKKKKLNRANLLDELSKVQVSNDELSMMTSISQAQTLGVKKLSQLFELPTTKTIANDNNSTKIKTVGGAHKRKRLLKLLRDESKKQKYDPNIVGLEQSDSNSDTTDESSCDEPEIIHPIETEKHLEVENNDVVTVLSCDANKSVDVSPIEINVKESDSSVKVKRQIETLPRPSTLVEVKRDVKIQVERLKLPILGEEQNVMEVINDNEIVIIAGETGSGKTTQVPQFLYEAGYAIDKMIGITEPRRVATVAMANRVGHELGLTSREVSYLMRFEGNVTDSTRIKFMTDGVLLKEIQSDIMLSKYSVIIIDEAHERSVYTDILIGLLSRIVPLRKKKGDVLRLIVMSATLRIQDFTENVILFKKPPPVIMIEARQFPVTVHFNRRTNDDYLKEAYKKTMKIHTKLPQGGILIFVTGQQEVNWLVRKLKKTFPYCASIDYTKFTKPTADNIDPSLYSDPEDLDSGDDEVEQEMKRARKARWKAKLARRQLPKINLDDYSMPHDDGLADLLSDDEEIDSGSDDDEPVIGSSNCQPLWVLPLYSMLSSEKQHRIFRPAPFGTRLCVVSTDVAETSITIPGIKYVVDTGKKKTKLYDTTTGVSTYRVTWTSKAGASQRSGRAGRVNSGHCYRLYSSAVFQHQFPEHPPPDILNRPIDDLLLQMKAMGIDKVVNFPFPTAPDRLQLRLAEKRLKILGILEPAPKSKKSNEDEILTVSPLGKAVSAFPVLPRFGKMLALSHQHGLLPYTVRLVAALSVQELISGPQTWLAATGQMLLLGDPGVLLRVVGAAEYAGSQGKLDEFCNKHCVREKAIKEIIKLVRQLTNEIKLSVADVDIEFTNTSNSDGSVVMMKPPDEKQARLLRQLILSGYGDQVSRKLGLDEVKEGEDKRKYKYAYHCGEMEDLVHLHSDSILKRVIPEWVVYGEVYETNQGKSKIIMRNVTSVEPEWLPLYVPQMCNLSEPIMDPEPYYDNKTGKVRCQVKGTFGKGAWMLPQVEIEFPEGLDKYKWFARFLLEGHVYPKLKKFSKSLLSPPSTMVKSWAKLQPRTEILLNALLSKKAGSKDQLSYVWKTQPKFLLASFLKWVPESAHNEVTLIWPPL